MKRVNFLVCALLSIYLGNSQKVVPSNIREPNVAVIKAKVQSIKNRRDKESKSEDLKKRDSLTRSNFKMNISYFRDPNTHAILQVNQSLSVAEYEVISYYYDNGHLIKLERVKMKRDRSFQTTEYLFFNKKVVLKNGENINFNGALRTAEELYLRGASLFQSKE